MNKQSFVTEVANQLNYGERPPHHIFRMIESCYLQEMSVAATVKAISEIAVGSTG